MQVLTTAPSASPQVDVYGAYAGPVPLPAPPAPLPTASYLNGQRLALDGALPMPAEPLRAPPPPQRLLEGSVVAGVGHRRPPAASLGAHGHASRGGGLGAGLGAGLSGGLGGGYAAGAFQYGGAGTALAPPPLLSAEGGSATAATAGAAGGMRQRQAWQDDDPTGGEALPFPAGLMQRAAVDDASGVSSTNSGGRLRTPSSLARLERRQQATNAFAAHSSNLPISSNLPSSSNLPIGGAVLSAGAVPAASGARHGAAASGNPATGFVTHSKAAAADFSGGFGQLHSLLGQRADSPAVLAGAHDGAPVRVGLPQGADGAHDGASSTLAEPPAYYGHALGAPTTAPRHGRVALETNGLYGDERYTHLSRDQQLLQLSAVVGMAMRAVDEMGGVGYERGAPPPRSSQAPPPVTGRLPSDVVGAVVTGHLPSEVDYESGSAAAGAADAGAAAATRVSPKGKGGAAGAPAKKGAVGAPSAKAGAKAGGRKVSPTRVAAPTTAPLEGETAAATAIQSRFRANAAKKEVDELRASGVGYPPLGGAGARRGRVATSSAKPTRDLPTTARDLPTTALPNAKAAGSVSYTHLTLPTIYSV